MPRYLSNADASKLRIKGKAKLTSENVRHLDEPAPAAPPAKDAAPESSAAPEAKIDLLAAALYKIASIQHEMTKRKEWHFEIDRDADGRIKKVVARA